MRKNTRAPALVLGFQITAIATARCLSDEGIHVQVAAFSRSKAGRQSNSFRLIDASNVPGNADDIAEWLFRHVRNWEHPPVVFPTSDTTALALAKHRDGLADVCHIWRTDYEEIEAIISKEGLYARALNTGVNVPPSIVEPNLKTLDAWCKENNGPYLVKPFYQNIPSYKLGAKNLVFGSGQQLLQFVRENGAESLIIQRLIKGGDGRVFDCYGLTNRQFEIITQASHTRIRQFPRNFGTTSYGEIPARPVDVIEEEIFELTNRLLGGLKYHGIFGIEWIKDRETNELYLLDFNARPFLSIGHLYDCGLNLPYMAYRELLGEQLNDVPWKPRLQNKFWLYFVNDCETLCERLQDGEITVMAWLTSLLKARSYACWRWSDIRPGLYLLGRYLKSCVKSGFRKDKR
jgi:predicted ATP-grasp superfamily ATP-dependent carboligase